MKKLALALALCGLTSLAYAGQFEDYTHNANYCDEVGKQAVQAYHDSQDKVIQQVMPNLQTWQGWVKANHTDLGGSYANADEAFHYAIRYAYTQASSDQDAYTTGYSHCMDALN